MLKRDVARPIQREQWLLPLLIGIVLALCDALRVSGHRVPGIGAAVTLLLVYTAYRAGIVSAVLSAGFLSLYTLRSAEAGVGIPLIAIVSLFFGLAVVVGWLSHKQRAALEEAVRAHRASQLSDARHRDLIEGLDAVVWEADADTFRIRFVSKRAEAIFGYSVAEWVGSAQIWRRLIHPDDFDRTMLECRQAVADRTGHDIEYRCVTRSGETVHVRDIVQMDHSVVPPVLRGVLLDVTRERRAMTALQETERKLRAFINNAPEALIVSDSESRIVEANERLCDMLGYSRGELLELRMRDIDMSAAAHPHTTGTWETTFRRKDGSTLPIQLSVSMWENSVPQMFIGIARDITQKNQLEAQLRQSQRMEALGRLAGGVAHDFNNLLTAIRGHADLLRIDLPADTGVTELQEIGDATERAAGLTRQLLAFSRQQMLQLQVLDLNDVVDNMKKLLGRLINENITLVTRLDSGLSRIEADRTQLEQVLMNLVLNARDAMPNGGKLTIRTANAVLTEIDADRFAFVKPGNYVLLAVSDEGVGMDAETVSHVFDPFFTTKEPGKGSGLGLATAYGIVKQLGGYIWCESKRGSGTTFRVYLPPAPPAAPSAVVRSGPERTSVSRGNETILVVEDELAVRSLVRRVLQKDGYRVIDAGNGVEALELVAGFADPIHLLLTDVVMPQMGGRDLADRLTPNRPGMKVLYMSGYAEDAIVVNHVLQPGFAFLPKPFAPDTLTAKVREALES